MIIKKKKTGLFQQPHCLVLYKIGRHMNGRGTLIEQLVATTLRAMARIEFMNILKKYDVPVDVMKNVQDVIEKESSEQMTFFSIEAEKAFCFDEVQRGFTDDGKGNGRALKSGVQLASGDVKSRLKGFVFGYPDRREVIERIEDYFEQADDLLKKTPWQLHQEGFDEEQWIDEIDILMLKEGASAVKKAGQLSWRSKVAREALITVLALLRYEKEAGEYPESLVRLVEGRYLKDVPMDPFSDGPLVYRKTDEGFILDGVGNNFTDEGGRQGTGYNGKVRMWADNGDWVFWPVD